MHYCYYPRKKGKSDFSFGEGVEFKDDSAIKTIERFIEIFWIDEKTAEKACIESSLPSILTHVTDGKYELAMKSESNMREMVDYLSYGWDRSVNMDF